MANINELRILYEDADIIVCVKPHGVATQSKNLRMPDMERMIKNHIFREFHTGNPYVAVIHRLDQPVKGILVFGKNKKAAANLNKQLTSGNFGKYYMAMVAGHPEKSEGDLIDYLVKDGTKNTSRVCGKDELGAKEARLHYRVRENLDEQSILEIHLDTGRHHQIRVQMSHMGNPLVGDQKYGKSGIGSTLCLCAYKLEFRHPTTGEQMHFELDSEEWW